MASRAQLDDEGLWQKRRGGPTLSTRAQDDPVSVAQSSVGISSMMSRRVAAAGFEAATVLYMYHTQHVTVCSQ